MEGSRVAKKEGGGGLLWIIAGVIAAAALGAYLGLCALAQSRDTILPNVTAAGVDVSNMTQEQARAMVACYRERYGVTGVGEAAVYPGIPEILDAIDAAGALSAVATLKHYTMAEKSLARFGLTHRFAATAMGQDSHPSKAQLIRQVMAELRWEDPRTAVMIGDSRYDGEGAQEAGVDFVPLTYGFGFADPGSLDGLPTVFTAHTPQELVEFVQTSLRT